jgi:hypothetical protein
MNTLTEVSWEVDWAWSLPLIAVLRGSSQKAGYTPVASIASRADNFSTLHNTFRFSIRGRTRPPSQKYIDACDTPTR